jgi:hypothetical protein
MASGLLFTPPMRMKMQEDLSLLDELLGRQQVEQYRREFALLPVRPRLVPVRARIKPSGARKLPRGLGEHPRRTAS